MATGATGSESSPLKRSSSSSSPGPSSGRPRCSPVWKFFEYDKAVDKSICQIFTESDSSKSCGQVIAGTFEQAPSSAVCFSSTTREGTRAAQTT